MYYKNVSETVQEHISNKGSFFSQKLVCIYENHTWQQIVCLNTTATLGSSNLVFQVMNWDSKDLMPPLPH